MSRKSDDWFFEIGTELQRLSDEVMRGIVATTAAARRFWRPNVDLCEREDDLLVTVELAGVDPEKVCVQFAPERNAIVVRGTRVPTNQEETSTLRCHQLELFYGEFAREVQLPDCDLDRDSTKAKYENGLLYIVIPKKKEVHKDRRTIPISEE